MPPSPLDQADLAEQLVVSPAQVSGAVERLRSLGLLERVDSQRDRRRQLWQVTGAGDALLRPHRGSRCRRFHSTREVAA